MTPFWIQEHEVTNGEYLEFLNDPAVLARVDAALAEGRFILYPRSVRQNGSVGGFWLRTDGGRFVLPPDWGPDLPVMTMTLEDARDYARWRSERDGRTYALPTRLEFQAAAYGSSQFAYPFGDSFRPKWVSSRTARETYRGFDPVMSFPVDESGAGVYDLSGSVTEMIEWDGSRGTRGMSVGGSALRGVVWEFAMTSLHPRNPDVAGGDCGFRLIFRRDER